MVWPGRICYHAQELTTGATMWRKGSKAMAGRKSKEQQRKAKRQRRPAKPVCGLCGSTTNLTRTECCGQWICDDLHEYVPFSYERNSCHRNHLRFTLCANHHHEQHPGSWQDCPVCREAVETEMYVWYGTNEYNFEKFQNPPEYEPTRCKTCNRIIRLSQGGYSIAGGEYQCVRCTSEQVPQPPLLPDIDTTSEPGIIKGLFPPENADQPLLLEEDPPDLDEMLESVPEGFRDRFLDICDLTDAFCRKHLNEEYEQFCREMALELCQDGSPASRGQAVSWAAGVVYALGQVNFLTDPHQQPHMTSRQIADGFGISVSNMQAKGRVLREGLGLMPFDLDWTLPSLMEDNPLRWMCQVDEAVVDIRAMPHHVQQDAFEKGLIPYIPADQED